MAGITLDEMRVCKALTESGHRVVDETTSDVQMYSVYGYHFTIEDGAVYASIGNVDCPNMDIWEFIDFIEMKFDSSQQKDLNRTYREAVL